MIHRAVCPGSFDPITMGLAAHGRGGTLHGSPGRTGTRGSVGKDWAAVPAVRGGSPHRLRGHDGGLLPLTFGVTALVVTGMVLLWFRFPPGRLVAPGINPELPDYFLEPNIMDDGEIEEIVDLFNSYYKELRNMQAKLISDEKNYWEIEVF